MGFSLVKSRISFGLMLSFETVNSAKQKRCLDDLFRQSVLNLPVV